MIERVEYCDLVRRRDFLVCVDSDGCVMDTMSSKHIHCFGPCLVRVWGLEAWRDEVMGLWCDLNLYRATRGINRFEGLVAALGEINEKMTRVAGIDALRAWCESTDALSESALCDAISACESGEGRASLSLALEWSRLVNKEIRALPESLCRPFDGAREGVRLLHTVADVAVVSSADRESVMSEWSRYSLLTHVDAVMAQDSGTKERSIARLLRLGYHADNVLTVGDSIGDMEAARHAGTCFFPIIPTRESDSWHRLARHAIPRLLDGTYKGKYQQMMIDELVERLRG